MKLQRDIKIIRFFPLCSQYWESWLGGPFSLGLGNVIHIPLFAGFGWEWGNNAENTLIFWSQGLFRVPSSASEELHKNLGGAWTGQVTWGGQRDIPHLGMPGPVYKLGELGALICAGGRVLSNCLGTTALSGDLFLPLSLSLSPLLLLNHDTLQNISGYLEWNV